MKSVFFLFSLFFVVSRIFAETEKHERLTLSLQEKKWLQQNPVVTYSEVDWKPLSIIKDGEMVGIMRDYMDLVSARTGITFKFLPAESWQDVLQMFKDKKIDMVPGISNFEPDRQLGGLIGKKYAEYPMAILTNESITFVNNIDQLSDKIFSLPKHYTSYKYVKSIFPEAKIIETTDIPEAILNVADNRADVFIGHLATSLYYMTHYYQQDRLKISGTTDFLFTHHFLVQKDMPVLHRLINRVIDDITESQRERIYANWVRVEVTHNHFDYELLAKVFLGVLVVFGLIIYWNRKQKKLLNKINVQNKLIEDSIKSASLIQKAIAPSDKIFEEFFTKYFCVWRPKDIVGGDIYFIFRNVNPEKEECMLFLIDCAGHGVSGAFLTMLAKSMCDQVHSRIKKSNRSMAPSEVLNRFREQIQNILQTSSDHSILHFDCGVICYDKKNRRLKYSGANIPLFVFQEGELKTLDCNRTTIGFRNSQRTSKFKDWEINVNRETKLYFATDGYTDQVGGPKTFPLGKKRFKKLLGEAQQKPFEQQKEFLMKALDQYRGNSPRVDDLTLIGLQIGEAIPDSPPAKPQA